MTLHSGPQSFFAVGVALAMALSGCGGASSSKGPATPGTSGVGVGCQSPADCRSGLSCDSTSRTCQPAGSTIPDAACTLSAECMPGYYCTQGPVAGRCEPVGTGKVGDTCADDGQCATGL